MQMSHALGKICDFCVVRTLALQSKLLQERTVYIDKGAWQLFAPLYAPEMPMQVPC